MRISDISKNVFLKFRCCGVLGGSDFEASWWRMQELGSREMLVPLTCCHLANAPGDERAFLDPLPHNNTVCQAPNPAENKAERFQKVITKFTPRKYIEIGNFSEIQDGGDASQVPRPLVLFLPIFIRLPSNFRYPQNNLNLYKAVRSKIRDLTQFEKNQPIS